MLPAEQVTTVHFDKSQILSSSRLFKMAFTAPRILKLKYGIEKLSNLDLTDFWKQGLPVYRLEVFQFEVDFWSILATIFLRPTPFEFDHGGMKNMALKPFLGSA